MADTRVILTGHRPTGPRHIGHLVGTLTNWARLQNENHNCYFLVADLHALTTDFAHPDRIQQNSLEVVFDWLAAGIDPNRSTLVLQSAVPEQSQLCVLLGMLVSVASLERVPTYKEQIQQLGLHPSLGLLTYPLLQTADILAYKADLVPVGEDQLPHVELSREVARRFNQLYGILFPEPEALLTPTCRLPGIDNRTMHTSYGNAIYIKDSAVETRRKVMAMYTDPTRIHVTDPGHVEDNPLFTYLDIFDPDISKVSELKALYKTGNVGDVAVKHYLVDVLNAALGPIRERRIEIEKHPGQVFEMLCAGSKSARTIARQTLSEVQSSMGLSLANQFLQYQSSAGE